MKKIIFFLISIPNLFFPMSSQSGEVRTYFDPNGCFIPTRIEFSGEIVLGDADKAKRAIKSIKQKYSPSDCEGALEISLDSTGGIVSESLEMGELLRNEAIITKIYPNRKCFSSCAFIFAGGVRRYNYGSIGIHRPYFDRLDPNLTTEKIRMQRDALNLKIRKYLEKIDVSPALLDDSLGIEPEKIKILSPSELEKYRLTGTDASYDELVKAKAADFWNMTSSEYRSRKSSAISQCQHLALSKIDYEYTDCIDAKFLRISLKEATQRRIRESNICSGLTASALVDCRRKVLVYGN
jgi:hypothetical protein